MIKIRLKEIAEEKELNLNYIILNSGVSTGTVRNYWHNDTQRVDLDVLDRLCKLLDAHPSEFFDYDDTESEPDS